MKLSKTASRLGRFIAFTIVLTAAALSALPSRAAVGCTSPPSGLVSWWRAEGNANDSADGNHGVLAGGTTFSAGEVGQAFSFNGSNAYVSVVASSNLNVGAAGGFTVEGWINPGDVSATHIIGEWNNGSGGIGVQFYHSNPGIGGVGALAANVVSTSGGDHLFASSPNLITANNFQHVALTYDKATGIGRLFCNGVAVAVQNLGVFTPQTTYGLNFGARASGFPLGIYFVGLMDELSLYGRALTTNEIQTIYAAGNAGKCAPTTPLACVAAPSGLVSLWRGENNALDSVDGNNGTLVGNTVYGAGRVGQGFVFDGTTDRVAI
ncbi:MAG: LamG domain-containing protein [Pedosphaera sp.]|nr:LamG domain-containing protein [Pedosphaera sp.]